MIVAAELAGGSDAFLRGVVMALAEHNREWYAAHPDAPNPAAGGVRYVEDEPSDVVRFYDAPSLLARGFGSCGSLAAAQWGWLRARGVRAWLIVQRRSAHVWHAVVRTVRGIWDPMKLPRADVAAVAGELAGRRPRGAAEPGNFGFLSPPRKGV